MLAFALAVLGMAVEQKGVVNQNYSPAIDIGDIPTDKCGVVVMKNEDDRLEVFAVGPDDAVYHKWQKDSNSADWTTWSSLGGKCKSGPSVAKDPYGRLQVFHRAADKSYMFRSQRQSSDSNSMSDWKPLGGKFRSGPVVARDSEGFLHIFGRGMDNHLHHRGQLPSPTGNKTEIVWTEWTSLGGLLTGYPTILLDHESLLHIFCRGQDRALWHLKQLPVQHEKSIVQWGQWDSLGGVLASSPHVPPISDNVNLIRVVVRAADKAYWMKTQSATHTTGVQWNDWKSLKGIMSSGPSVVVNDEGTLDVFGRGPDKHVWHKHEYLTKEGLTYTSWQDLGGIASTGPVSVVRGDGLLQLFARGPERAIWTRSQEETKNGTLTWGAWESLGGNTKSYSC